MAIEAMLSRHKRNTNSIITNTVHGAQCGDCTSLAVLVHWEEMQLIRIQKQIVAALNHIKASGSKGAYGIFGVSRGVAALKSLRTPFRRTKRRIRSRIALQFKLSNFINRGASSKHDWCSTCTAI